MATEEQLKVTIQTVADTAAVERYGRAIQQVQQQGEQSSKVAEAAARAAAFQRAGGMEAALQAARGGPPGAGAAAQITQTAVSVRQLGLAFLGASTAGTVIHHVLQQVVDVTMKAVEAERQHSAAMASTIPMYGSYTGEIKNLAGAMNTADQSAAKLMATLGKVVGPTATTGANAENSVLKFINNALDDTSKKLNEIGQNPVLDKILTLAKIGALGVPPVGIPAAAAITVLQQLGQTQAAQAADRTNLRLRQLNATENTPPVLSDKDRTDLQARLDWQDQIRAAATALNDAQNVQIGLQHQAVNLTAQEAAIRLSMLPTQERLAALQRDATEQVLRARQAALPATEGLEDVESRMERDRLVLAMRRQISPSEARAARLDIRNLARNVLPGARLAAFDATRPVELAGRVAERADIEQQLFQITQERGLATVNALQEANGWLRQIAQGREQGLQIQITLTGEGFMRDVEAQITSVFHTARMAAENAAAQNLAGAG